MLCSSTSGAELSICALRKSQDPVVLEVMFLVPFEVVSVQSACRAYFADMWAPISSRQAEQHKHEHGVCWLAM